MNNPLGVNPSKGNQGTTRGKENIFCPRWESNSTTSRLDLPFICRLSYDIGQRKSGTIQVVDRGEEKVRIQHSYVPLSSPTRPWERGFASDPSSYVIIWL